jgi:hypothetical protein
MNLFPFEAKTGKAQTQTSSKRHQLLHISPPFQLETETDQISDWLRFGTPHDEYIFQKPEILNKNHCKYIARIFSCTPNVYYVTLKTESIVVQLIFITQ